MSWLTRGAAVAAAVTAGSVAVGRAIAVRGRGGGGRRGWPLARTADEPESRWYAVTINRSRAELMPDGRLPDPLARLGDQVEVRVNRAAGGRGTEVAARLRENLLPGLTRAAARAIGDDPRLAIRSALRLTKQIAETGEVLNPNRPGTTRPTVLDRPLAAARRARGERPLRP